MTSDRQRNSAVSIEDQVIFTGRSDPEGAGKVFVHKLLNYSNGKN